MSCISINRRAGSCYTHGVCVCVLKLCSCSCFLCRCRYAHTPMTCAYIYIDRHRHGQYVHARIHACIENVLKRSQVHRCDMDLYCNWDGLLDRHTILTYFPASLLAAKLCHKASTSTQGSRLESLSLLGIQQTYCCSVSIRRFLEALRVIDGEASGTQ